MRKYTLLVLIAFAAMPVSSIAQVEDPVAEEHFRQALAAAGGMERFNTLKAPTMWMETGTYYGMGAGTPFIAQYATYWPKRWYRQWIEGQFALGVAGDQVTLFAGDRTQGQKVTDAMQQAALRQSRIAWAQLLFPLGNDDYTLTSIPGVEVDGKPTVGINAAHESGDEIMLYFDKSTFLLVKTQAQVVAREAGGELVTSETFFSAHQSFGGVILPSKYRILHDGKRFVEGEKVAIKVHATIDPAWFGTDGPPRVR